MASATNVHGNIAQAGATQINNVSVAPLEEQSKNSSFLGCLRASGVDPYGRKPPKPAAGTCAWVLKREKYSNWRTEAKSSFLWLSGDPRCGKSVLARFLVEHLRNEIPSMGTVCHFFFNANADDTEDKQTMWISALQALAYQFLVANAPLLTKVTQDIERQGQLHAAVVNDPSMLWNILTAAATSETGGNCVIILDALDECKDFRVLTTELVRFFNTARPFKEKTFLKVIVTGRPYDHIETSLYYLAQDRLKVENEQEAIRHDIAIVVKTRLQALQSQHGLTSEVVMNMEKELIVNSETTYLWLQTILELIEEKERSGFDGTKGEIRDIMQSRHVYAIYPKLLARIPQGRVAKARIIFNLLLAAGRPLQVDEINIALAYYIGAERTVPDGNHFPSPERSIRNHCGLLVRVVDSKVYLSHQTLKGFLVPERQSTPSTWRHSFDPAISNQDFALVCVNYLYRGPEMADKFPHATGKDLRSTPASSCEALPLRTAAESFFEYAAVWWPTHFEVAEVIRSIPRDCDLGMGPQWEALVPGNGTFDIPTTLQYLSQQVCSPESPRFRTWFELYWYKRLASTLDPARSIYPGNVTELMVRVLLGHRDAFNALMGQGTDVNAITDSGMSAYDLACHLRYSWAQHRLQQHLFEQRRLPWFFRVINIGLFSTPIFFANQLSEGWAFWRLQTAPSQGTPGSPVRPRPQSLISEEMSSESANKFAKCD